MKIVQLNVRFSEGGAAKIARNLHTYLLEKGISSEFLYGYSSRLRDSEAAILAKSVVRVTNKTIALFNFLTSKLVGIDSINNYNLRKILSTKQDYIIHLHAIHSHMLSLSDLEYIVEHADKIVMTLHDFWILTGRCAVPGECTGWRSLCDPCQNHKAYPGTTIDVGYVKNTKFEIINRLVDKAYFVSPSKHLKNAVLEKYPKANIIQIRNSVDYELIDYIKRRSNFINLTGRKKLLVISNNLSDCFKNDWAWIKKIVDSTNSQLILVGNNCPVLGFEVNYLGEISSRNELYKIVSEVDALLFTSSIDNAPLVLLESLCLGTPVIAKRSDASDEILLDFEIDSFVSASDASSYLNESLHNVFRSSIYRRNLSESAVARYSPDVMLKEYFQVYKRLSGEK